MKINCEYCGKEIDDTLMNCPYCGAPVEQAQRSGQGEPSTIEELKQWYIAHNLPPEEVTRFFIGKDVSDARAFGIFEDGNGNFVVYKNKDNGSRAIRSSGKDEKYAVNELYQKLKEEITHQKTLNKEGRANPAQSNESSAFIIVGILITFAIIAGIFMYIWNTTPDSGYYNYNGDSYYYYHDNWYVFDDTYNDWQLDNSHSQELNDHWQDYQSDNTSGSNFYDSSYYNSSDDDWGSDWDNDSSWDSSDSWDSGGSDWDSDW